jgi:DinB superfamily
MNDAALRAHLTKLLAWHDAHVDFDAAVSDLPAALRGRVPPGAPYSIWQLVEHLRLAQHDILDFCVNPDYKEMRWPDDYWPADPAPPDDRAWSGALDRYQRDLATVQKLAADPAIDLCSTIPHGSGQTYLREILLVADHAAYHIGQIVIVRRLLGAWDKK